MRFFLGVHQPSDARHFERAFISINRLKDRKSDFQVGEWILDSGAFSTIQKYAGYPEPVSVYADQIKRWKRCGTLLAAVTQDYMCEPYMLALTGLTVQQHQKLTISRYDALIACDTGVYIMPVLQGYSPEDYIFHIRQYGSRLRQGAWVGVGSVCKRNGNPKKIREVITAIQSERPDLDLHGFGLKTTALADGFIRESLHSTDSMSWSFSERKKGGNANDYRVAERFAAEIDAMPVSAYQIPIGLTGERQLP
jgi:hypothetical protein